VQPLPKPKFKRRVSKAKNNPKPTIDSICRACGAPYAERHEVFFGTGERQKSIQYGLQVDLCGLHHRGDDGPHINREVDLRYKREFQEKFELEHSRELFMKEFGRNYLED